jgi:hypothetical protein
MRMSNFFPYALIFVLVVPFAVSQDRPHKKETRGRRPPSGGYVPDAITAVKIAEAVLMPVYGEQKIASERPFTAKLDGDVWTVDGTLYCGDGKIGTCDGGAARVKLSKNDARILFMIHYQ